MKNVNNNELDLALRALAKSSRDESSLRSANAFADLNEVDSNHLDADELNSYAEGLVPELAQVRYTEHLADCSNCRGILVSLTQSREMSPVGTGSEVERGPRFWEKILAFLSLPAVRYGVPALALTAIIAVGLLALRQERRPDLVAQNQPGPAITTVPNQEPPSAQTSQQPLVGTAPDASPVPTPTLAPNSDLRQAKSADPESPKIAEAPTTTDSTTAPALKDTNEAMPPPPAPAAMTELSRSETSNTSKFGALTSGKILAKEPSKGEDKKDQPEDRVAQQRERSQDRDEAAKEAEEDNTAFRNTPSGPRRSEGIMSGGYGRKNKRESADEDDTRSIGGRRFKRQGSLWVDTAYESSRATINVRRGSEQFRALVADEPGIRTIADALAGDIIVVWKGKAYHIR